MNLLSMVALASKHFQKTSPTDVAKAINDDVKNGVEDIFFPDAMARQVYTGWRRAQRDGVGLTRKTICDDVGQRWRRRPKGLRHGR
jgi:hypothetical protein